jgi:hypothetical protein
MSKKQAKRISATKFERELAALLRLKASGQLSVRQFNDLYVDLLVALRGK